jgi:hypothetical protein
VKDAAEGYISMEGGHKKPRAEEVSGDKACNLVPNLRRNALGGGYARKVDLKEGKIKAAWEIVERGRTNDGLPTQMELDLLIRWVER